MIIFIIRVMEHFLSAAWKSMLQLTSLVNCFIFVLAYIHSTLNIDLSGIATAALSQNAISCSDRLSHLFFICRKSIIPLLGKYVTSFIRDVREAMYLYVKARILYFIFVLLLIFCTHIKPRPLLFYSSIKIANTIMRCL